MHAEEERVSLHGALANELLDGGDDALARRISVATASSSRRSQSPDGLVRRFRSNVCIGILKCEMAERLVDAPRTATERGADGKRGGQQAVALFRALTGNSSGDGQTMVLPTSRRASARVAAVSCSAWASSS